MKGVALHRDPARLAHEADELVDLLLGLGAGSGGVEDRLSHHGSLHVVGAEVKPDRREGMPIMIQYALMFGMLSSIRRETAIILRSSDPVV